VTGPPPILRALRTVFPSAPAWTILPEAEAAAAFEVLSDGRGPSRHQILREGAPLWESEDREMVVPALEWAINSAALEHLGPRTVLFHAGSVAYAGRGMLLPAASGGGKTTLVAGLVRAGFRYLSDEVAILDPATLRLAPFAKSLSVKAPARAVLAPLYPELAAAAPRRRLAGAPVWDLRPPEDAWPAESVPVRYVVLPRYAAGAQTALEPISRSTALVRLLGQSFNLPSHGAHGVARTVEMLRGAACYALTVGDLQGAVDRLEQIARS
jgi:HprK-related kinase A